MYIECACIYNAYTHMYIHVYHLDRVCVHIYIYIYVCVCVCDISICLSISLFICVFIYLFIFLLIDLCIYVFSLIYLSIHSLSVYNIYIVMLMGHQDAISACMAFTSSQTCPKHLEMHQNSLSGWVILM